MIPLTTTPEEKIHHYCLAYPLSNAGLPTEFIVDTVNVIRAARKAREDWAQRCEAIASAGDDQLVYEYFTTEWDEQEWDWR